MALTGVVALEVMKKVIRFWVNVEGRANRIDCESDMRCER